ncbi:MAG: hypothetical protein HYV28_02195 [Ignavibacteriales bacterium]|nr:hypothetical protein [Ignavibacteriales bacterium]
MEEKKLFSGRTLVGVLFIVIGAFYLLSTFNVISDELRHVFISWPSLLIVIGVVNLINSRNNTFGIILIVIGGIFLLKRVFPGIYFNNEIIVPMVLIGLGSLLIFRRKGNKDRLDEVAIFGGGERYVQSDNFVGGNILAVFGGMEIDLTECKLGPGENVLDIVAIFGGCEIRVPQDWKIVIDVVPIFGGFSQKFRRDPNLVQDPTKVLKIKGVVIFGGGELKMR